MQISQELLDAKATELLVAARKWAVVHTSHIRNVYICLVDLPVWKIAVRGFEQHPNIGTI